MLLKHQQLGKFIKVNFLFQFHSQTLFQLLFIRHSCCLKKIAALDLHRRT